MLHLDSARDRKAMKKTPLEALRYHVTGAIERGEKQPVIEVRKAVRKKPELTDFERQCLSALVRAYGRDYILELVEDINLIDHIDAEEE